jgi:hypothetical protein
VPLSPWISTDASESATSRMVANTSCILRLFPRRFEKE